MNIKGAAQVFADSHLHAVAVHDHQVAVSKICGTVGIATFIYPCACFKHSPRVLKAV